MNVRSFSEIEAMANRVADETDKSEGDHAELDALYDALTWAMDDRLDEDRITQYFAI